MTQIKCQAKNPSACRFHKPNAGAQARYALAKAESKFIAMETHHTDSYSAIMDAKWAFEEAQEDYYGTAEGLSILQDKLKAATTDQEVALLSMHIDAAQYRVAEAEIANQLDNEAGGSLVSTPDPNFEAPTFVAGGDPLWPTTTGSKYQSKMWPNTHLRLVKEDLKAAQKAGYLPKHLKFKFNSRRGKHSVTIIGAADKQVWGSDDTFSHLTPAANELIARSKKITNAYSHVQYDHVEGRNNLDIRTVPVAFENPYARAARLKREAASLKVREESKTNKAVREQFKNSDFFDKHKVIPQDKTKDGVEIGIIENSSIITLGNGKNKRLYDFNAGKAKIASASLVSFFRTSTEAELHEHYKRSELK
jgi:hypothetical protein